MNLSIIDGHNLLFKSFYGPRSRAVTPAGTRVNAVCRFCALVARAVRKFPGNRIFVVFDSKTGADTKKQLFPRYKAQSRSTPDDLFVQLAYIKDILGFMNIKWCEHPSEEGDDVIASLAEYWVTHHGIVTIFSNDQDFIQLMSPQIRLQHSKHRTFTECVPAFVMEKYGISPNQYADYRALCGNKAKNKPSISGISQTTARELLNKFGSIENILKNLDSLPSDTAQIILNQRTKLIDSQKFLIMKRDIPLNEILSCEIPETDVARITYPVTFYLKKLGI